MIPSVGQATAIIPWRTESDHRWSPFDMAWAKPNHTRGEVDTAGKRLVANSLATDEEFERWDQAVAIINNWRAAHSYPLLACG